MWGNPFQEEDEFAGHPPLTKACLNNHLDFTVNYLSSLPADRVFQEVNHKDPLLRGDTPLMLAANYGYVELVSFLLKSGARKDIRTYKGTVYDQIMKKYERLCESIVKKDDVDTQSYSSEEIRQAFEVIKQFNKENPEIDLQERDKLARVLEILEAHKDPTNVSEDDPGCIIDDVLVMISSLVVLASLVVLLDPVDSVQTVSVQTFTSGSDGLLVTGPANSVTGNSLAQIGDYNGDGTDDFAVGSMLMTVNSVNRGGLTLIVLGQNGAWPAIDLSAAVSGATTRRIYGSNNNGQSGSSVGGAGDVNDDGFADVVIGSVWVIFGSSAAPANFVIDTLGSKGVLFGGAGELNYAGYSLDGAGDFNNDGIPDLVFGANGYSPVVSSVTRTYAGAVYVMYGRAAFAGLDLATFTTGATGRTDHVYLVFGIGTVPTGDIDLADAPEVIAFTDNGNLGVAVYGGQDVSGDGIPDMMMGSSNINRGYLLLARCRRQSEEPVATAPPPPAQYEMTQIEEGTQVRAVVYDDAGTRT
eukprot:gene14887-17080_t